MNKIILIISIGIIFSGCSCSPSTKQANGSEKRAPHTDETSGGYPPSNGSLKRAPHTDETSGGYPPSKP